MSRQTINGPPVMPPLYSLLQAADIVEGDGDRWHHGLQWQPEQVGGGAVLPINCVDSTGTKPEHDNADTNTADPFIVYAEDHCSSFGFEARDYEGRARRQLLAVQSARIAAEFQYGTIAGTAGGGENASLVMATEVGDGATDAASIAALEGAMAAKYDGGRGMIHVSTQALDVLLADNVIYQAGQKWLTATGTIVVGDAGYGGEGAGSLYAYGTPIVQVRLSPIEVPMTMREALDRQTNDVKFYAERLALVQVDHTDQNPFDLFFKVELSLTPWAAGS